MFFSATPNLSAPVGHLPVEWTFHLGGIFPREESVLFADMANRLLSCNINNLETEPQFDQCNVVSSDTETTPEQPIYDEQIYEVWGEATYGELISNQDNLGSEQGIDYTHLRDLLVAGRLSEADEETLILMLRTAKREEEGWLDAESIKNFPCTDLHTVDQLWVKYSNGRFGFSIQKRIWESMALEPNADDEKWLEFGKAVGWRGNHEAWQEYRNITFSENAPLGHLPIAKLGGGRWTGDKAAQRRIIWGSFIKWVSSLALRLAECGL